MLMPETLGRRCHWCGQFEGRQPHLCKTLRALRSILIAKIVHELNGRSGQVSDIWGGRETLESYRWITLNWRLDGLDPRKV
jgi:hypothetical protein